MFIIGLIVAFMLNTNGSNLENATLTDVRGFISGEPYNFSAKKIAFVDSDGSHMLLDPEAADALTAMMNAAGKEEYLIDVNYAFRDNNTQKKLYRHRTPRTLVAKPGWSLHQSGLAIDIAGCVKKKHKTSLYWWLHKNAPRFGYSDTIKSEPWHFEFKKHQENKNSI